MGSTDEGNGALGDGAMVLHGVQVLAHAGICLLAGTTLFGLLGPDDLTAVVSRAAAGGAILAAQGAIRGLNPI